MTRTSDITAVQRRGHRRRSPRLDISWCGNELGHPRFGVIVPRHGQTAVARNRLRRRVREIVRLQALPALGPFDLVVRTRAAAYRAKFNELAGEIETWARSLSE